MGVRVVAAALALAALIAARAAIAPPEGVPLVLLPQGISYRVVDGEHVFVWRTGSSVFAFDGRSTAPGREPIVWCPGESAFVAPVDGSLWNMEGAYVAGPAPRDLDRIGVTIATGDIVRFDVGRVTRAKGRSAGTVSGDAGQRYRGFRDGRDVGFCTNPVPAPDATPAE